jgi:probable rRNA maturation factor
LEISTYNAQDDLLIDESWVKEIVCTVLEFKKVVCDEVILHFVDQKKIAQLHLEFFKDPTPTDCISFPIDSLQDSPCLLGEIFICPAVAQEYVKKKNESPYNEVALYIIHGLLHLLGYDDLSPEDRKRMRKEEKRCLELLRIE